MTFNPEQFGIERIPKSHYKSIKDGMPYIRRCVLKDGTVQIYARLNEKLTQEFNSAFGKHCGIGFMDGNVLFYPEDDAAYAVTISGAHGRNSQIAFPTSCYDKLLKMFGDEFVRVPCKWVRHIFGGRVCFEFVGCDVEYKPIVSKQVVA